MKAIIGLLICTSLGVAQSVYEIPFASKGNTIELAIANNSSLTAEGVKVEATSIPEGIKFTEKTVTLPALKSKEELTASFTFSVEKTAKVNKEDTLRFTITIENGQTRQSAQNTADAQNTKDGGQAWTKEIKISITPPTTYELLQNYPNPFNPTTVISYQLSAISNVNLRIYDIIGREVVNLVNEQQEPGYYQKTFDARKFASGMYVYRLIATDEQNHRPAQQTAGRHVFQKKMMLVK